MSDRPVICGFLKVRDEIVREGNLFRVLANLARYCDAAVICDDASVDGTAREVDLWLTQQAVRTGVADHWRLIQVPAAEQDFRRELHWKQRMLEEVHAIAPEWVFWMDGDEVLDAEGTATLRQLAVGSHPEVEAWAFHYTQCWRVTNWARTDAGFDDGWFIKLWRWRPDLSFEVVERTHHHQFPVQVLEAFNAGRVLRAPFEVIHYGNVGVNLRFKCIQYWGGLGGVDRHLVFPQATYRPVERSQLPPEAEWVPGHVAPFTEAEIARIRELRNLRALPETFCVVIPAYNRAATLEKALASVVEQTYPRWVAVVLDDGSTDETPAVMRQWQEADPRIFYCRFPEHRGAVAVNEIGMDLASEWAQWWARLGSDDWWEPQKLAFDALALQRYGACQGPYRVWREGAWAERCNPPRLPEEVRASLLGPGGFVASWANFACRTEVLREVKRRWGRYGDPRLQNMEDFLINARIARVTDIVWRGQVRGEFFVGPALTPALRAAWPDGVEPDAAWRAAGDGASANWDQTVLEDALTRRLIQEESHATELTRVRAFWRQAAQYPPNKELVYPEHAEAQEFDRHGGARVLEYGCGGGADALSYLRRGCEVWYADIVPENVEAARQRIGASGLEARAHPIVLEDSAVIALPDASVDLVNCHGVLHHIPEPAPVLDELWRVLRPGGWLYLMLYTEQLWRAHCRRVEELQRAYGLSAAEAFGWCTDGEGVPYARWYLESEGWALLAAAGFRVAAVSEYNDGLFRTFKARKPEGAR